jgi:hypothetical protein
MYWSWAMIERIDDTRDQCMTVQLRFTVRAGHAKLASRWRIGVLVVDRPMLPSRGDAPDRFSEHLAANSARDFRGGLTGLPPRAGRDFAGIDHPVMDCLAALGVVIGSHTASRRRRDALYPCLKPCHQSQDLRESVS